MKDLLISLNVVITLTVLHKFSTSLSKTLHIVVSKNRLHTNVVLEQYFTGQEGSYGFLTWFYLSLDFSLATRSTACDVRRQAGIASSHTYLCVQQCNNFEVGRNRSSCNVTRNYVPNDCSWQCVIRREPLTMEDLLLTFPSVAGSSVVAVERVWKQLGILTRDDNNINALRDHPLLGTIRDTKRTLVTGVDLLLAFSCVSGRSITAVERVQNQLGIRTRDDSNNMNGLRVQRKLVIVRYPK